MSRCPQKQHNIKGFGFQPQFTSNVVSLCFLAADGVDGGNSEAGCVSGLSLDHQTVSAVSRVRLSEREEESLSCFLRACDAALSFLQELDKVGAPTC